MRYLILILFLAPICCFAQVFRNAEKFEMVHKAVFSRPRPEKLFSIKKPVYILTDSSNLFLQDSFQKRSPHYHWVFFTIEQANEIFKHISASILVYELELDKMWNKNDYYCGFNVTVLMRGYNDKKKKYEGDFMNWRGCGNGKEYCSATYNTSTNNWVFSDPKSED